MNREIKFRGKMIPENEWIFGTILRIPAPPVCFGKSETDKYYIQFPDPRYMPDWNMPYKMVQGEVNPETIGQYTGLHDKNGKEIYEGDIIEFSYDVFTGNFDTKVGRGIIEFIDGAFYIKPFEIEGKKIKDIDNEEWFLIYTVNIDTLKVIGNIYDNPELLGGE